MNLGRMALLVDTSGGLFGAIEPYSEEAFIAAGEPGDSGVARADLYESL